MKNLPVSSLYLNKEKFILQKNNIDIIIKSATVLKKEKKGRSNLYFVEDEERIAKDIITYKQGFLDELVYSFTESWMDLNF